MRINKNHWFLLISNTNQLIVIDFIDFIDYWLPLIDIAWTLIE